MHVGSISGTSFHRVPLSSTDWVRSNADFLNSLCTLLLGHGGRSATTLLRSHLQLRVPPSPNPGTLAHLATSSVPENKGIGVAWPSAELVGRLTSSHSAPRPVLGLPPCQGSEGRMLRRGHRAGDRSSWAGVSTTLKPASSDPCGRTATHTPGCLPPMFSRSLSQSAHT